MATYVLVIEISSRLSISIGRLGDTLFKRGYYLYTGSAKRGLDKRISRHLSRKKKLHWHIDYILNSHMASIIEVWTEEADLECETSRKIDNLPGTEIPRKGIGASDCSCPTHFYYFDGGISEIRHHLKDQGFVAYAL